MAEKTSGPATPEKENKATAPIDKAEGHPKIGEDLPSDQKIAGGGGGNVFGNAPLVKGIPVVVPIQAELAKKLDVKLVEGVALAAPVVEGTPEMISNAQAEASVEENTDKPGDIKGTSWNNGEAIVTVIDEDGIKEDLRFAVDESSYKEFEESFQDSENWKSDSKKAFARIFKEDMLHPEDAKRLEGKKKAAKAAKK